MTTKNRGNSKGHLLAMSIVAAVLAGVLVFVSLHFDVIPHPFSRERTYIDSLVRIMFAIASVFFAGIVTVFAYSLIFFRRRPGDDGYGKPTRGNPQLELAWTLVPLAVVIGLSISGGIVLAAMDRPAEPAGSELQVKVLAFRFGWQFSYPQYGNATVYELEMPVNRRVHFLIQSKDVVHSFWVQDLGPKQDAVPGLTTELYVTPTKVGDYQVECSQLCGSGHTYMTAPVHVVSDSDFQAWVTKQPPPTTTLPRPTPSTPTPVPSTEVTVNLSAKNIAFSLATIQVSAGAMVTVNFDNQDASTPHNFAVYTDSSATKSIFVGKVISGPSKTVYTFMAPSTPGAYFFRCDVHPTIMTGTFVVE